MAAIRCAAREVLISGEQRARAVRWQQGVGVRWKRLTGREREVLRLLVQGLDNQAIAQRLGIAPRTVECHITHILDKLGVRTCREALVWARDNLSELLLPPEVNIREFPDVHIVENPDTKIRDFPD
ncbi:MAG: helix-turn-helix transcriptional regulator [Anaerolineae bacterium]|nr:helix-turn-helix transcriptional regulator [Anaerolineae bacterium]